jgi:hypothetical protein
MTVSAAQTYSINIFDERVTVVVIHCVTVYTQFASTLCTHVYMVTFLNNKTSYKLIADDILCIFGTLCFGALLHTYVCWYSNYRQTCTSV